MVTHGTVRKKLSRVVLGTTPIFVEEVTVTSEVSNVVIIPDITTSTLSTVSSVSRTCTSMF